MAIGIGRHATNIQQYLLASNFAQGARRDHMFCRRNMARLGVFQSRATIDHYERWARSAVVQCNKVNACDPSLDRSP